MFRFVGWLNFLWCKICNSVKFIILLKVICLYLFSIFSPVLGYPFFALCSFALCSFAQNRLLFRSKSLLLKSDCDPFPLVALWQRATVSESLLLLFTKERLWANRSFFFFLKSNDSGLLVIRANRSKKKWFVFHSFPSFYVHCSRRSSLSCFF